MVRYLDKDEWKPVETLYQSFITKGGENRIYFKPVRTKGIRKPALRNRRFSF